MHQHGPTDLTGPVRGTNVWWQGTGAPPMANDEGASVQTRSKKGKRMARGKRGARRGGAEGVRPELVDRVRREIAAGTYDSPEKWEAALDRLLDRLGSD
jgi:negative regulator of flagellin synthesis FlgM